MKALYKKNMWFNAAFILVSIIVGYLSNSNAMLADALFCLSLMAISIKPKSLFIKIYTPILTAVSVIMCWFTFSSIQTSILDIGLADAPQLWALPFLAIIFIAKIFLVFVVTDTEKTEQKMCIRDRYYGLIFYFCLCEFQDADRARKYGSSCPTSYRVDLVRCV